MRAAYGSRPAHRHHGNNSNDGATVVTVSVNSTIASSSPPYSRKMVMTPFLRLDSTGEVASDDSVQSAGHQRAKSYRQGAPSSVTNTFLGKMFQFVPQPSAISQQLTLTAPQTLGNGGISMLDELLRNRQTPESVAKAGMRTQVKMAQSYNVQRPKSRYGQWGVMSPRYPLLGLPPGVFPCHVFSAVQSQCPMWTPPTATSGQFVHMGAWPTLDSMASNGEHFSVPKNAAASLHCAKASLDSYVVNDAHGSSIQSDNVNLPMASVETGGQGVSLSACSLVKCRKDDGFHHQSLPQMQTQSESDSKTGGKMGDIDKLQIPRPWDDAQQSVGCAASVSNSTVECEANVSDVCKSISTIISGHFSADNQNTQDENHMVGLQLQGHVTVSLSGPVSVSASSIACAKPRTVAEHPADVSNAEKERSEIKETEGENNLVGAWCLETPQSMSGCSWAGSDQDLLSLDDDFWADSEDDDGEEIDEDGIQEALSWLPSCGLNETIIFSKPCKKQIEEELEVEEKRCRPKPHRAANKRWDCYYSATVPAGRRSKVQFSCGEEVDRVHLFEKDEGETLTMMEIQKARDFLQQHEGKAARLLQTKQSDDDDASGGVSSPQVLGSCVVCDGVAPQHGNSHWSRSREVGGQPKGSAAAGPHHDDDDDFGFEMDGVEFGLNDLEADEDGQESEEEGDDEDADEDEDDDEFVFFGKEEDEEKAEK